MSESLNILLDQNVPFAITSWFRLLKPSWTINHVSEIGLKGKSDNGIFKWAQANKAIIVTYDEYFADQRSFPVGKNSGIIRLRVWPTTIEETQKALERLISETTTEELNGALVIINRTHIRIRKQL